MLITDKTISRAFSVGQEVGHAKKSNKQIIPLVAKGVPRDELGFLSGITYIPLDTGDPAAALQTLKAEVEKFDAEARLRQLLQEQKKKEGVVVLAGLALLLYLLNKE